MENRSKKTENFILFGDFNTTLEKLDRSSKTTQKDCPSHTSLRQLINKFNLEDVWRKKNPKTECYTHYHAATNTSSRIDRVYTTDFINGLIEVKHEINSFSDHYNFITLKRKTKQVEKNKSYWILDPSIIKEEQFKEQIKAFWQIWKQPKPIFPNMVT